MPIVEKCANLRKEINSEIAKCDRRVRELEKAIITAEAKQECFSDRKIMLEDLLRTLGEENEDD